jgi:predicted dehydrogenase
MKVYKVGIIAFGGSGIAQFNHFQSRNDTEVVAIFDVNNNSLSRAKNYCEDLNNNEVLITDDFDKFLKTGIEIGAICSPDNTHANYIQLLSENGIHILCEKPLCDSIEDCKKILSIVEKNKHLKIATQHQMRFVPLFNEIKKNIDKKELGEVFYIEGYYVHNLVERANLFDDWRFTHNATPIVYCGCHFIDLFRWLLDDEVELITMMGNNIAFSAYPESDFNSIQMKFKSGIIANVVVAFGAGKPQDHTIKVFGTKKCIENNMIIDRNSNAKVLVKPNLLLYKWNKKIGLKSNLQRKMLLYKAYFLYVVFNFFIKRSKSISEYGLYSYPIGSYEHELAVKASIENFMSSIKYDTELLCNVSEGVNTVLTCLNGLKSFREKKFIEAE